MASITEELKIKSISVIYNLNFNLHFRLVATVLAVHLSGIENEPLGYLSGLFHQRE